MAKRINTRVQHKYDTEENWKNASFIPLRGELIIYGDDKNVAADKTNSPTIKVGDGKNTIGNLKALSGEGGGTLPKPSSQSETDVLLKYECSTQSWVTIEQDPENMSKDQILMYDGKSMTWSAVPLSIYNGEVTK